MKCNLRLFILSDVSCLAIFGRFVGLERQKNWQGKGLMSSALLLGFPLSASELTKHIEHAVLFMAS